MPNQNDKNRAKQKANHNNPNKGTSGNNLPYAQDQGNKGKQLNPNQK